MASRATARWIAAASATALAALFGPGTAAAQVDTTCELTLTRFDPDTVNVLFPDESAQYWSGSYRAIRGTRIRIEGQYPYARYMSWNVYDPALRPFDHLTDRSIAPDAGSSNPFLPGAARYATPRSYTMFIEFQAAPADPAQRTANTIYVDPAAHPAGLFTYRVYIPDRGFDATGGVGLPRVTLEPANGTGGAVSPVDCRNVQKPTSSAVTDTYAEQEGPDGGPPYPGRRTPVWRKFVNIMVSGRDLLFDNEWGDQAAPVTGRLPSTTQNGGSGGFLSNLDNAYVYSMVSRGFGRLLVIRGRAPTFADTRERAQTMPTDTQLRFWSFCQNDPFTQRYVDCVADDQTAVDSSGNYTIVMSTPANRPKNARAKCGVTWLAWGPQPQGVLIYRHMLPDPSFAEAIQNVEYGREREGMGAYYPTASYLASKKDFERRGCRQA